MCEALVEHRMPVGDARARSRSGRAGRIGRSASAAARRRDRRSCRSARRARRRGARAARRGRPASARSITSWFGLARPSCRTATASPPQITFAPLSPNRCQRRRVSSLGCPSTVPSQPSIGRIAKRLPARRPSASSGWANGEAVPVLQRGVEGQIDAELPRVLQEGVGRLERRDARITGRRHGSAGRGTRALGRWRWHRRPSRPRRHVITPTRRRADSGVGSPSGGPCSPSRSMAAGGSVRFLIEESGTNVCAGRVRRRRATNIRRPRKYTAPRRRTPHPAALPVHTNPQANPSARPAWNTTNAAV